MLKHTLDSALEQFSKISMSIDPDKSELIHFTWKQNMPSPPLSFTHNHQTITLTPPSSLCWLGFYLDRKLSFSKHVKIMAKCGNSVVHGLSCLGNSLHGMNQYHLWLLYKTCVIPVLTYGCQLWFNPNKPNKCLLLTLQWVQNNAICRITGSF